MTRIVKGLAGTSKSSSERILQKFGPSGFSAPGATGFYDAATRSFGLTRTPAREAAVAGITGASAAKSGAFANLREQVAPGFGRLSTAMKQSTTERIESIRNEGRRTTGNIRENLARRRLAGSSFQESEVASAEAEFSRQQDIARAEGAVGEAQAFLSEIETSAALMKEEFDTSIMSAMTVLQDLNFDTEVAAKLSGLSSQLLADNANAQAEARAAQENAGEDFLGAVMSMFDFF